MAMRVTHVLWLEPLMQPPETKFKKLPYVFTALVLGLASVASLSQPVAYAVSGSDQNLIKLENKFFQHDYAKDDMSARLERLEKMVFGETKTGSDDDRLKKLIAAVPNLNESDMPVASGGSPAGGGHSGGGSSGAAPPAIADEPAERIENASNYPAVTAMEKTLFGGKDFANEPIAKRLDRLELKKFGKAMPSAELIDRVDRLRSTTGVDVAKQAPGGSDWADDDEHYQAPKTTYNNADTVPFSSDADGRTFSGRNLRKDFADAGLYTPPAAAPGTYGSGGGTPRVNSYAPPGTYGTGRPPTSFGNTPRGTYGSGGSTASTTGGGIRTGIPIASAPRSAPSFGNDGMPKPAPDIVRGGGGGFPPAAMGLSQQVAMLEKEVFQRTYSGETIPQRLDRLEKTMYPNQAPSNSTPIPSRVSRLMQDVQPQAAVPVAQNAPWRTNSMDDDMDADLDALASDGMPPTAPPMTKGGLSRIINGLGNLITGGMGGGYGTGGSLIRDPSTGLLIDQYTGNLIDPTTGVVVGTRGMPGQQLGGFGSFGSGMSPMGGGYGVGSRGMGFGFGGSGVRFGPGMILP